MVESLPQAAIIAVVTSTNNETDFSVGEGDRAFLAGFLDDNGNADMNDPYADMGDLAAAEGFGPACLEITVAGDEVAAGQFVLNIAVPF